MHRGRQVFSNGMTRDEVEAIYEEAYGDGNG
jgi:hypothetical protein